MMNAAQIVPVVNNNNNNNNNNNRVAPLRLQVGTKFHPARVYKMNAFAAVQQNNIDDVVIYRSQYYPPVGTYARNAPAASYHKVIRAKAVNWHKYNPPAAPLSEDTFQPPSWDDQIETNLNAVAPKKKKKKLPQFFRKIANNLPDIIRELREEHVKEFKRQRARRFQGWLRRGHPILTRKYRHIGPVRHRNLEDEGKQIGAFHLEELLGQGGFGQVFSGFGQVSSADSNDAVAVKVLKKSGIHNRRDLKRVNLEIGLLRNHGHHPNIIGLYDAINAPSNIYLVMEKATMDLDVLRRETNVFVVQPSIQQQVMLGILRGARYLHERGIAHLDLKGNNILICTSALDSEKNLLPNRRITPNDIRLADFGVSEVSNNYDKKKVDCGIGASGEEDLPVVLDCRNGIPGTRSYQAPEIFLKHSCEGRIADMWSIGCILMRLVSCDTQLLDIAHKESDLEGYKTCFYGGLFNAHSSIRWRTREGDKLCHNFLFKKLLVVDPKKRASSMQALQHPWFQFHYPESES